MRLLNLFVFRQWNLRSRAFALVTLPLVCIILLTLYNINTAISRENVNLQNRGEGLLVLAANAAQLPLFAGDITSLNTLSSAIMNDSQISNVLFFDEEQDLLSADFADDNELLSKRPFFEQDSYIKGDYWYFIKAVRPNGELFEDDQEQFVGAQDTAILGWVVVVVDLGESHAYQAVVLRNNLIIAVLMLSVGLWLAFRFSRAVVGPIISITAAVRRFGGEDFSQRVDEVSAGELGILEKGINLLAKRVGQSQLFLKEEVDKATKDLELKNIDLAEAKEAADAANMAKDDFLARMSHELRTPLTGIQGFTRLLAKTEQADLRKEYSDMIVTSSSVLLSTINDILDFSKLQANSFTLNPSQFSLEHCLRNVMDLHRIAAFEKAIELNVLIESDVPTEIVADLDKLQKVVNNIVSNAVKFTPTGDIIMFVSLAEQKGDESFISISVKDSGIGISKENIKYLFNPFYQSDESTTRRHGGTGLGLAIAEDFVNLMGGTISVDSTEGEGTVVEFEFRCTIATQSDELLSPVKLSQTLIFDNNPWTRRSWRNQMLKYSNEVFAPATFDTFIDKLGPDIDLLLFGLNYHDCTIEEARLALTKIRARYDGTLIAVLADDGSNYFAELSEEFSPLLPISKPLTNQRLLDVFDKSTARNQVKLAAASISDTNASSLSLSSSRRVDGLNILIAEDNKFNQTLLARLMEAAGASVTLASDGQEAMEHCEQKAFDVLLLDLHMPILNGLQLSSAIRAASDLPNHQTPIILLTADVQTRKELEILATGVNAINYKPIDEDALIDKIISLSAKAPTLREASQRTMIEVSSRQLTDEVDRQLSLIGEAFKAGELVSLQDQVHQLKGVVGLSGLDNIKSLVNRLNTLVLDGDLDQGAKDFERLSEMWERIKTDKLH